MIKKANFALFPSEEFFGFAKKSLILIEEKKSTVTAVEPFLSISKSCLEEFKRAIERESKNPQIKNRTLKAMNQNDAFMALRKQAESASTRQKPEAAEAAKTVIEVIRKYGWNIHKMGQKLRLTQIEGLITELSTKHAAQVAAIGATDLLDELAQAQAAYLEADTAVVRSESNSHEPTVNDTRQQLSLSIKQLFQIISLQKVASPSPGLTALTGSLNELITSSLATVKATDTRSENAKKATDGKQILPPPPPAK